jgi:hypothetical protein
MVAWGHRLQYGSCALQVGYPSLQTHSQYVILIAFALQQWLLKRTLLLRYTYIACLFRVYVTKHKERTPVFIRLSVCLWFCFSVCRIFMKFHIKSCWTSASFVKICTVIIRHLVRSVSEYRTRCHTGDLHRRSLQNCGCRCNESRGLARRFSVFFARILFTSHPIWKK